MKISFHTPNAPKLYANDGIADKRRARQRGRSGKPERTVQEQTLFTRPVTLGFRDQTRYFPENAGMFIAQQALPCSLRAPTSVSKLAAPQNQNNDCFSLAIIMLLSSSEIHFVFFIESKACDFRQKKSYHGLCSFKNN